MNARYAACGVTCEPHGPSAPPSTATKLPIGSGPYAESAAVRAWYSCFSTVRPPSAAWKRSPGASAVAQPLAQTERIVVISSGGGDGAPAGASRVARDVADIVSQVPATVEALTGINLIETLRNLPVIGEQKAKGEKPPVEG